MLTIILKWSTSLTHCVVAAARKTTLLDRAASVKHETVRERAAVSVRYCAGIMPYMTSNKRLFSSSLYNTAPPRYVPSYSKYPVSTLTSTLYRVYTARTTAGLMCRVDVYPPSAALVQRKKPYRIFISRIFIINYLN